MDAPQATFGPVTVYFGDKNGKYPDGNQVVVTGADTKVMFDTPLNATRLAPMLSDADLIVLGHVHEDHTAGLYLFPNMPLQAPEQDLYAVQSLQGMMDHFGYSPEASRAMQQTLLDEFTFSPRPDARAYAPNQEWDLGGCTLRAVHTPGHTRGHSALVVEPHGSGPVSAFIGDIDLSSFGPYYGDACSNMQDFIETLDHLAEIDADVWITFHHKGVITDQDEFRTLLQAFRGKIDQREAEIVEQLRHQPMTLADLVAHRFVYPPHYFESFVDDAERKTLTEHLDKLIADNRVRLEDGLYHLI